MNPTTENRLRHFHLYAVDWNAAMSTHELFSFCVSLIGFECWIENVEIVSELEDLFFRQSESKNLCREIALYVGSRDPAMEQAHTLQQWVLGSQDYNLLCEVALYIYLESRDRHSSDEMEFEIRAAALLECATNRGIRREISSRLAVANAEIAAAVIRLSKLIVTGDWSIAGIYADALEDAGAVAAASHMRTRYHCRKCCALL